MKASKSWQIKRRQREECIKAQVKYAKAILDVIDRYPNVRMELDTGGILPNDLIKDACEKFIKENEI